jgi:hypothetical protein
MDETALRSMEHNYMVLEAISKPQIAFEGKAGADDKAQHTREVCEHFEEALNTAIGR